MRILMLGFLTVWLLLPSVAAQSTIQSDYDKQYYLFVAPGMISGVTNGESVRYPAYPTLQVGGGGERFLVGGLAFGVELACSISDNESAPVASTFRNFKGVDETFTSRASSLGGWLAFNPAYYFNKGARFTPFVTGGWAAYLRGEPKDARNYGGGFQLWRSNHRGWRVEYRKFHELSYERGRLRSVRIGLVLR